MEHGGSLEFGALFWQCGVAFFAIFRPSAQVREICIIVHVGGTRCVTWSIDRIIQIHACITWGVEFIRAIFFIFFLYV